MGWYQRRVHGDLKLEAFKRRLGSLQRRAVALQMALVDFAAEANGGQISGSTSYDEQHPPSNIIDGDSKSFWVSTGLYPQEFTVELAGCTDISTVPQHFESDCSSPVVGPLCNSTQHCCVVES